jgi:hypothetical protein
MAKKKKPMLLHAVNQTDHGKHTKHKRSQKSAPAMALIFINSLPAPSPPQILLLVK